MKVRNWDCQRDNRSRGDSQADACSGKVKVMEIAGRGGDDSQGESWLGR